MLHESMTIRTRLTLWYSSLLAVVIIFFGISMFGVLNYAWRDQIETNLKSIANQVYLQISTDSLGHMIAQPPDLSDNANISPFFIQVWDSDRRPVYIPNSTYIYPLDPGMIGSSDAVFRHQYLAGKHLYVLTYPIFTSNTSPPGSIQVATRMDSIDQATERLLKIMIGVGLVALLLAFMVGSVIAGQALQPIDTIAQAAAQITAADDLSRRIPYDGPDDELGQLIVTFNATLERLERLFNAQRRFVADVSHELRTPLTTIQGNLDLIKRMGLDQQSMEAMSSEISRMSRLVGDLLLLARADSGHMPLTLSIVDLDTLVLEVMQQGKMLTNQLQIKLGEIQACRVNGDSDRLKQLLLNLVTNAIKYTPPGGTVTLSLTAKEGYAFVKVADTGIGIPKGDLAMIFDRFYRVDKARSREMGGTGLGLSIAQWIARAHHARIIAESEVGKGSAFTLQISIVNKEKPPEDMRETRPRVPSLSRMRLPALPSHNREEEAD